MKQRLKIVFILLVIVVCSVSLFFIIKENNTELKSIKSEQQLYKLYNRDITGKELLKYIVSLPFSLLSDRNYTYPTYDDFNYGDYGSSQLHEDIPSSSVDDFSSSSSLSSLKEFSTTNIQVENVDEADIIKTDGDYIYSISGNNIVITDATIQDTVKLATTITPKNNGYPIDLLIHDNLLVIISTCTNNASSSRYFNTGVEIYDVSTKATPKLVKSYELYEPYYTSRLIDNHLYVISSGYLRSDKDSVERGYTEDRIEKEISLKNIKYLKDVDVTSQTLISSVDLEDPASNILLSSYLIDISNAYVSENNIYLLDESDEFDVLPLIPEMFGINGILACFDTSIGGTKLTFTKIFKFNIKEDGNVEYTKKAKIEGETLNQYSLDEKDGHLRLALDEEDKGSRIVIFDEELKEIGSTDYVEKNEDIYAVRFINDRAYLVTYKSKDPLFAIDLSDETSPKVLGKLEIPGYSSYLHPYDEDHLIGIGMQTEEKITRGINGEIVSASTKITGMKMALFDISDITDPIQISETVIGDSRTTSAILTNPKALLFSKEKELIAIPVNNYAEDFEIDSDSSSKDIDLYKKYEKEPIGEGYIVYNIDLESGFRLKGVINHENTISGSTYKPVSKLLRGLYINDNLYTVSETDVKVNRIDTLELIDELKLIDN